eukprot:CAMPEP_0181215142 /NCGR_PEP_ID=MMETSP1096-20121128/25850_1 /TAXON_ID=156174 ORGANISM="Chrysochromulina ericina, Strain CCMP281" /NCGR_SAMPLE_ID=MMETSP1096 /ASSEMBLY_ACC=CAM_ASM_000453 /LENGTH=121 /DNA_ID=CAMNT_0023306967 /DNA_START=338 /DNA_END=704 /DNA_ORIENTATION=+
MRCADVDESETREGPLEPSVASAQQTASEHHVHDQAAALADLTHPIRSSGPPTCVEALPTRAALRTLYVSMVVSMLILVEISHTPSGTGIGAGANTIDIAQHALPRIPRPAAQEAMGGASS